MSKKEQVELDEKKVIEKKAQEDLDKLANVKIPTRRVRMMMVNPTDFLFLFTKGLEFNKRTKVLEGVPEDAKLIGIAADSIRNGIMMVVESKEYEEIPINVLPPVQMVKLDVGVRNATKKSPKKRKK